MKSATDLVLDADASTDLVQSLAEFLPGVSTVQSHKPQESCLERPAAWLLLFNPRSGYGKVTVCCACLPGITGKIHGTLDGGPLVGEVSEHISKPAMHSHSVAFQGWSDCS